MDPPQKAMWLMFLALGLSGMAVSTTTTTTTTTTTITTKSSSQPTTMPSASQLLHKLRQKYPVLFEQSKPALHTTTEMTPPLPKPEIVAMHISSSIEHRYATTQISARLLNPAHVVQAGRLTLWLPDAAFISGFSIDWFAYQKPALCSDSGVGYNFDHNPHLLRPNHLSYREHGSQEKDGRIYNAVVGEKSSGERKMEPTSSEEQMSNYLEINARDTKCFVASVPLEPGAQATFNLTYEELLVRRMFTYTHTLTLDPGQSALRDLDVTIDIKEARPIAMLRVTPFRYDLQSDPSLPEHSNKSLVQIDWLENSNEARIRFAPTREEQKFLAQGNPPIFGGQLTLQYDVDRSDAQPNQVLIQDGYLVHFFAAPTSLQLLRKHIIFVLDISGSMEGRKIAQLKQAMSAILDELNPNDFFNVIEFSYSVTVWNLDSRAASVVYTPSKQDVKENAKNDSRPTPAFPASKEYIERAKAVVSRMRAGGGTNMYDTLVTATRVARRGLDNITLTDNQPPPRPIIVFLTDGEPTVGELDPERILAVTRRCNANPRAAIFSLAFGEDADLALLRRLALTNGGFVRKIYEAADASEQLRIFFKQIASPLLANVTFKYAPHQVEEATMTKCEFAHAFAGSELLVAGHLRDAVPLSVQVEGIAADGQHSIPITVGREAVIPAGPNTTRLERIWAYLTINQLLEAAALDREEALVVGGANERALYLALRYGFVTPLTTIMLEKADGTNDSLEAVAISPRAQHRYYMSSSVNGYDKGVQSLKIVNAESLSWLMAAIGNSSHEGEPLVMLSTIRSGLRYAANRTADIPYQRCAHVAHPDAYCRHLKFCALNLDFETYSRSYHCEIGGAYLGVCCPEWLHEQVADPISS